jgi:hypothetical protein
MSRLTIDITDQQHQSLKALAASQGKTVKQYAIECLLSGGTGEDQAWQTLQSLLTVRINDALAGKVSARSVSEIVDEELAQGKPA